MIDKLKRWGIEIALAIVVAAMVFSLIRAHHETTQALHRAEVAEKEREEGLKQAALGKAASDRAQALQQRVDGMAAERQTLMSEVGRLEQELARRPMPPRHGPAPTEQVQVIADLQAMGTAPEAEGPFKLAFPMKDAPTLWTWGKQAARVPDLESRIGGLDDLTKGLKLTLVKTEDQLKVVELQRDEFKESSSRFQDAFQHGQGETQQLKLEVGSLTTQRDRARRTRIYVGIAAFVAGVWVAKH